MHLILFTGHYPFGNGEEFLEDEIRVAEEFFDKITIVTMEKYFSNITRYVPRNAEIIAVRKNVAQFRRFVDIIPCLFKLRVWQELSYIKKNSAYSIRTVLKSILIQENSMCYIRRHRHEWIGNESDTVYYSYWLGIEFAINNRHLKGIKISRAHGGDCFYSRGYHPYRKEALRNLDFVFSISEAGCKDIVVHYEKEVGGLMKKVKVARLGIKIPKILNPYLNKKVKTIVTCSNVIQLKRLDMMIDALSEIADIEIEWVHFGKGVLYEEMIQRAKEKLGNKNNIRYVFKGYIPNNEIMDFYESNSVDLFVNCSDVEGIPVSMMEAMAYGIPAIGRNVGGMQELIDDSCGILLPDTINAHDLSLSITEMLGLSLESNILMRKAARGKITTYYDAEKNYRELFEFVKGCLNENE